MVPRAFVRQYAVSQQIDEPVADQEIVLHYAGAFAADPYGLATTPSNRRSLRPAKSVRPGPEPGPATPRPRRGS